MASNSASGRLQCMECTSWCARDCEAPHWKSNGFRLTQQCRHAAQLSIFSPRTLQNYSQERTDEQENECVCSVREQREHKPAHTHTPSQQKTWSSQQFRNLSECSVLFETFAFAKKGLKSDHFRATGCLNEPHVVWAASCASCVEGLGDFLI